MLDVCLLGCGGMLPLPKRFLTSLLVRYQGKGILIDCGESTQVALHLCGWSVKQIDHMLITHFHGDHVLGLPGLWMTMGNNGRTEPVHIWGNSGLKEVVEGLMVVCPQLTFEVICHDITACDYQFEADGLQISAVPVEHRVPCLAYSIALPRVGKFDAGRAKAQQIPIQYWSALQKGETIVDGDTVYRPEDVLGAPRKGLKISYATDCRPSAEIVALIQDSDLFVAEGLYGDPEKQQSAGEKGHMVYQEAAQMAVEAKVGELWLTHYSPAMTNPEDFLHYATEIFPNTKCGTNLMTTTLRFAE